MRKKQIVFFLIACITRRKYCVHAVNCYNKKALKHNVSRLFHKQGMRESNSRQRFWRTVYIPLQPLQTHEKTLTINNFTTVLPHFMKLMYLTDLLRYVYPNQMV